MINSLFKINSPNSLLRICKTDLKDSGTLIGDMKRIFDELSKSVPKWDIVKVLIKSVLDGLKFFENIPPLVVQAFKKIVDILSFY